LNKFGYIIFPENVSLTLAVAEALNIDRETALAGMLKARPDPGALQIRSIGDYRPAYFVNAFAANDPSSTLMIWNHISSLGYPVKNPIVVLNCRPDRVDRTIQYSEDVLPNMEIGTLIVLGQSTKPIKEAFDKGKIKAESYKNYEGIPTIEAFRHIEDNLSDRVIFCVGNIHGAGEEFIELVTDYANNLLNSTLLQ
jgi:poly-gamma-glutamate synthase PgsB/CapB